ncbi:hypothetical protein [Peribacillus glennii]|uniref:hypothetical protein n=1 Tax=Peribacillus glennii TaxID=2303991 RepID=UPI001F430A90|nr:hypothetical protein [Peribacillus glennii]
MAQHHSNRRRHSSRPDGNPEALRSDSFEQQGRAVDDRPINEIHDEELINHFREGIGSKVFVLSPSYPFMFIGEILDVVEDMIEIAVETTHFQPLENRIWFIHVHNIEVFYIERPGEPRIPELNDMT